MISLPPKIPTHNLFHCPELHDTIRAIIANTWKNMSREMRLCIAAGVETETVMEGDKLVLRTVPKVGIADMGDGTVKVFVRYNDESPQEASTARRSAGHRRGHVSKSYL